MASSELSAWRDQPEHRFQQRRGVEQLIVSLPQQMTATAMVGFASVSALSAINGPVRHVLSQEIVVPQWPLNTSALLTIGRALGWARTAAIGGYLIVQAGFDRLFLISAGLALAMMAVPWPL